MVSVPVVLPVTMTSRAKVGESTICFEIEHPATPEIVKDGEPGVPGVHAVPVPRISTAIPPVRLAAM